MADENKGGGWFRTVVVIGILLAIGYTCSHVEDEMRKVDTFTSSVIALIIIGLIVFAFYASEKNKK